MSDTKFNYMMLDRLRTDAQAYIDHGGRLWGIDPITHANEMVKRFRAVPVAPQWFTLKELKETYFQLTKKELKS
tara:strand:+ start:66 stop:287 length:222 start_codon:yes stop_codon:yes gene_type:complete